MIGIFKGRREKKYVSLSKMQRKMSLPTCSCRYTIPLKDSVWQLSCMPDMVTEGDGDKYIGYEYIGESYSGNRRLMIEEKDALFAKRASEMAALPFPVLLKGQKSLLEIFQTKCFVFYSKRQTAIRYLWIR